MNVEKLSFINLVRFYQPELKILHETHQAKHFTTSSRRSLRTNGVFTYNHSIQRFVLTPEAEKVLKDLSKMTQKTPREWVSENAQSGRIGPGPEMDLIDIKEGKS